MKMKSTHSANLLTPVLFTTLVCSVYARFLPSQTYCFPKDFPFIVTPQSGSVTFTSFAVTGSLQDAGDSVGGGGGGGGDDGEGDSGYYFIGGSTNSVSYTHLSIAP